MMINFNLNVLILVMSIKIRFSNLKINRVNYSDESNSVGYSRFHLYHFGIDGVFEAYQASDALR